jgi:carbonic anhydrase
VQLNQCQCRGEIPRLCDSARCLDPAAGLLIVIGIQLLKPAHIETPMKHGDLVVYVVTAVSVIFLNLLHGVMIGLALAIALTGWRVIRARVEAKPVGDEWRVAVEGSACTFLALPPG